jgi:hypothetical protein
VRGYGTDLLGRKSLTESRHWSRVLLRRLDAVGDGLHDEAVAAIAVEPLLVREVRAELRPFRFRSVTCEADAAGSLAEPNPRDKKRVPCDVVTCVTRRAFGR